MTVGGLFEIEILNVWVAVFDLSSVAFSVTFMVAIVVVDIVYLVPSKVTQEGKADPFWRVEVKVIDWPSGSVKQLLTL